VLKKRLRFSGKERVRKVPNDQKLNQKVLNLIFQKKVNVFLDKEKTFEN
jgi:hypothetical protein